MDEAARDVPALEVCRRAQFIAGDYRCEVSGGGE